MTDRTVDLSALLDVPGMARAELRWMWPRVDTYRAADSSWRLLLNRYPGCVIGIAAQLGHRVVGLRWGRPGRVFMVRPPSRH